MSTRTRHDKKNNYYHIFNRGADGAPLFHDHKDFEHFIILLYIANNTDHFTLRGMEAEDTFATRRTQTIVDIVAYCLLPDQFHLVLRDREPDGTRHFIHKVGTAYVMYYNHKYGHLGTVFAGTYRARRVLDQSRLYEMISRVHLYPFSVKEDEEVTNRKLQVTSNNKQDLQLEEAGLKLGKVNMKKAVDQASEYEYSSMRDYLGEDRPQGVILTR
jgi:putative transposase